MFGRRAVQVSPVSPQLIDSNQLEPEIDPLLEVSLASVPDRALWGEVRRRGFAILPAGVWESTVGDLEAELAAVKAHVPTPAEWMAAHHLVDGTEVVKELGEYAGTHFPAAVAEICELGRENNGLRSQLDRVENEASVMAQVILAGGVPPNNDTEDHDD